MRIVVVAMSLVFAPFLLAESSFDERRAVSEGGGYEAAVIPATEATALELLDAMDVDLATVIGSSLTGSATANVVLPRLGVIEPRKGDSFALLATGMVGAVPEPGTDFGFPGTLDDRVELMVELAVPAGLGTLAFDFAFLSSEYPEFVQVGFNDYMSVILGDAAGFREIARTEVDTAQFFPASVAQAAGTGYDLFTDEPDGIDMDFGPTGLPDAGLSNFIEGRADYESDGEITLFFLIQDFGDGLLDSAVLLDNFRIASFEAVDPNPDLLSHGTVTTDRARLAGPARLVRGAAADGVTQVLLRMEVDGPGQVEFSLPSGQTPEDGGFTVPGATGRLPSITVAVGADNRAFAIYQVPEEFNRGTDTDLAERDVTIEAVYTPISGDPVATTLDLVLVRPPILFIHGLWSSRGDWELPLTMDERFSRTFINYDGSAGFARNIPDLVPNGIEPALRRLRRRGFAATQMDAVCHSMGGLLARIHSTHTSYRDDRNFDQGDFRKLLTLDSPHIGSLLALFLTVIQLDDPVKAELVKQALFLIDPNYKIDEGAIFDLAFGSSAIEAIQESPVPSHALIGVGGSDFLTNIAGPYGNLYRAILFFESITGIELFDGSQHDAVVRKFSQQGGLPDDATSVFGGGDGIHIGVGGPSSPFPGAPASPLYSDRLITLLDTPVTDSSFAFLPAPTSVVATTAVTRPSRQPSTLSSSGLTISAPSPGTTLISGSMVSITVTTDPSVERVLLVGPTVSLEDDSAPFAFELTVPEDAIGEMTFRAFGANSQDELFESEPVTWIAEPAAALESIDLRPDEPSVLLKSGPLTLEVLGLYANGVTRDLTDEGVTYISLDSSVLSVDTNGLVTPVGVGIATVLAQFGGFQDSVTIYVEEPSALVFADGFELGSTQAWSATVPEVNQPLQ